MRIRFWAAIAMALSFLLGSVALAGPASAARSDCASDRFCFWVDTNYTGPRYNLGAGDRNSNLQRNRCDGCRSSTNSGANGTWNDMASSWYNHTSIRYCIYLGADYGGSYLMLGSGGYVSYSSSWNDRMTSVRPAIYRSGSGTIPGGWFCR